MDLLALSHERDGILHVDLANAGLACMSPDKIRNALLEASKAFDIIVVDLPPPLLLRDSGWGGPVAAAAACDAVLLLCLSGETTHAELQDCMRNCMIQKLKVVGLVLNDAQLRFGGFLGRD
jgi:Mrp family chromosome partitioning ATPase